MQQHPPSQRSQKGREKGQVAQQRHDFHRSRLAKDLLNGRIADRDHKTQPHPLDQAQPIETLHAGDLGDRRASQHESGAPDQHEWAPSMEIRQRADQPWQQDAAQQVQVECVGNLIGGCIQIPGHHEHGGHDQVAGHIGKEFKDGDCQAEACQASGRKRSADFAWVSNAGFRKEEITSFSRLRWWRPRS